jgi:hypothetical protein
MILEPNCHKRQRVHFIGVRNDGDETTERVVRKAFPDGVPRDIAYGDNPHTKPYRGDHGVRYEQARSEG